jgi:hypothetical protein
MYGQIIGQTVINSVTCLLNQPLVHLSQSDMLYYYISEITTVNAVFCDAGDGDHQNDEYDSDALFTMGMTRLRGASPALVKHLHQ